MCRKVGGEWAGRQGGQTHLPGGQTAATEQVPTGLDFHILVALRADLTELERGVHGPVELQLLLAGEKTGRMARDLSAMGIQVRPQEESPKLLCQP